MERNRKYIVLTILVAMVAVAGYLNRSYNDITPGVAEETSAGAPGEAKMVNASVKTEKEETDVLKEARESREASRSRAMELLNSIINDESSDAENKEKADARAREIQLREEAAKKQYEDITKKDETK